MAIFHVVHLIGVCISHFIRFARVCSHVKDFYARNKCLNAKLIKQGYRYHKLRKALSKFYRRHYELVSKFNVGLKSLLHQGLSEPGQFRKIKIRHKRIGYDLNFMRQSA